MLSLLTDALQLEIPISMSRKQHTIPVSAEFCFVQLCSYTAQDHLHHQASSVNFGSDTLVIAPVCHDCTYYIGISAYGNVNLTATIEASFGEPTQLSLGDASCLVLRPLNLWAGSPFTGNVSQTRSNQFTVEIPKPTTGTVSSCVKYRARYTLQR